MKVLHSQDANGTVKKKQLKDIVVGDGGIAKISVANFCGEEMIVFVEVLYNEEFVQEGCKVMYKVKELESSIMLNCHYPVLNKTTNRLIIETNGMYRPYLIYDTKTTTGSMAPTRIKLETVMISTEKAMALKINNWQKI